MYRWDGSFDFKRREDWDYKQGAYDVGHAVHGASCMRLRHSYNLMAGMRCRQFPLAYSERRMSVSRQARTGGSQRKPKAQKEAFASVSVAQFDLRVHLPTAFEGWHGGPASTATSRGQHAQVHAL